MATDAQITANRLNAQNSTGPKTPEGKAAVRFNAVKHGFTAKEVIAPTEISEDFEELRDLLLDEYKPATPVEFLLVHRLALAAWRLRRVVQAETNTFAVGFADRSRDFRKRYGHLAESAILAHIFGHDAYNYKIFSALSRYELKLERAFFYALHELQRVQARRGGQSVPLPLAADIHSTSAGEEPS